MKRIVIILFAVLLTATLWAQSPQKMSYQAIIRDVGSKLVQNKAVGMKISILKGTASGSVVYTETQTPTTNTNGLVSIEFGGGAGFSTIDWSSGPYFIKTETDPTGGNNYTITGTSQLQSVPYALHAKTAESITANGSGTDKETDRKYVGDYYGGGVIFWVNQSGTHGLIVSMTDISKSEVAWCNLTNVYTVSIYNRVWDGLANSNAIVAQAGHTSSAAKLCLDYTNPNIDTGVYSDWYLPAIEELKLLHANLKDVNIALVLDRNTATNTIESRYWSSSWIGNGYVWVFNSENGEAYSSFHPDFKRYIRAVRAF